MGDVAPQNPESALQLRQAFADLIRHCAGENVCSETFLAAASFPHDVDSAIELIYTEFATREELGQRPTAEGFTARFPDLADALRRQLDVHSIVSGAVDEPADGVRLLAAGRAQQTPTSNQPVETGRQIGGFRILAEMARGGMGIVESETL